MSNMKQKFNIREARMIALFACPFLKLIFCRIKRGGQVKISNTDKYKVLEVFPKKFLTIPMKKIGG